MENLEAQIQGLYDLVETLSIRIEIQNKEIANHLDIKNKSVLKIHEAAKFLNIGVPTIRRLYKEEKVRAFQYKRNGSLYFKKVDLEIYQAQYLKQAEA
ncbi:helix-turn-helix domain-containing protein [Aureispira sp. CCB-QB1]|uniref:helix-turn-helix domain-containing protein n=1 Tax=Aureispira sp. CCB-QB1 TaxID=1313421 RepID=UPI000696C67E|nr:helix-turn-helix domain-containing protein [Aureispira sp. CCB-QB1]